MFERQEQYLTSDKSGILGVFFVLCSSFFFAYTVFKYCAVALCRDGSKKRPDLSYSCFSTRPNERTKWKAFCKRAEKKFNSIRNIPEHRIII